MSSKLWLLGCAHYGERNQDRTELAKYRGWAKRNNVDVAILGDALDTGVCFGTKHVGSIWNNTLSPQGQVDAFVEDFKDLNVVRIVKGNHEKRVEDISSIQLLKLVADRLHVPYLDSSGVFVWNGKKIFVAHGSSSGYLTDFKKVCDAYEGLDVIVLAHTHKIYAEPIRRFTVNAAGAINERKIWLVRVGSFLKDAEYAKFSLHPPTSIGSPILEIEEDGKLNVRLGL